MRALTVLALLAGGCATLPPQELIDARNEYALVEAGPAEAVVPTDFYEAKKALAFANARFTLLGNVPEVRDQAYVALRRAQLADVRARTELDAETSAQCPPNPPLKPNPFEAEPHVRAGALHEPPASREAKH